MAIACGVYQVEGIVWYAERFKRIRWLMALKPELTAWNPVISPPINKMRWFLDSIIPPFLKESVKRKLGVPNIFFAIERLKTLGFNPSEVVDVGAYEGLWTKKCLQIFTEAHFLMVEAMPNKEEKLRALKKMHNVDIAIELLGARSGADVYFSDQETASSVLEENVEGHFRSKRITTRLNEVVERYNIKKVDFLKLDVQGYELEVLKGFDRYLPTTEVVLSEVSLLDIHKNVPLIREVLNFMHDFGFVVYDICSTDTRRPLDRALWQTDLLFVKENSIFRKNKRYQAQASR